ncbi:MAG: hypothetical protein CSA84_03555 [Actinomycetales bacterium]|nr:MAG: hypothetical protein CSA84_03555 [Actinomycetales bacterium]
MPRTPGGLLVLAEQHPEPDGPGRLPRRRFTRLIVMVLVLVLIGVGWSGWQQISHWLVDRFAPTGCVASVPGGQAEVTPEQAANAATISAVAVSRRLPTRAATIAVATAMQESKLRGLRYGDRDSLGLFQQRPSQGWGTPEQILDPVYASNAFYDRLILVSDYTTLPLTEAAQEVQISAAPTAYAQHEDEALALSAAFTGAAPRALTCQAGAPDQPGEPARVREQLSAQHGIDSRPIDPTTIEVAVEGPRAWAVAQWAVAHVSALQVERVDVLSGADGSSWERHTGEWASSEDAGSSRPLVRIVVAS